MPIEIKIEDHTGNTTRRAKMSETAPVSRLIPAVVSALGLPLTDPAGRPITYHLSHNNRQLEEEDTLTMAGVQSGDSMTIVPEMTAGGVDIDLCSPPEAPVLRNPLLTGFPSFLDSATGPQTKVAISRYALDVIHRHALANRRVEVGGLVGGRVYTANGRYAALIDDVIPGPYLHSEAASVRFTRETWRELSGQRLRSAWRHTLGWYHSHPGFGIFLSGTDLFTQAHFFASEPWYLAVVVDPSSGEVGVFRWENGECKLVPNLVIYGSHD